LILSANIYAFYQISKKKIDLVATFFIQRIELIFKRFDYQFDKNF